MAIAKIRASVSLRTGLTLPAVEHGESRGELHNKSLLFGIISSWAMVPTQVPSKGGGQNVKTHFDYLSFSGV